ncbi:hypothetical protein UA08_04931A, partial [Talaromyces atroroseus]
MSSQKNPDCSPPERPLVSPAAPSAESVPIIEPISGESDDDNNYWSDAESDLTSLTSSVTNYIYENGRRYHSFREGKYVLPNDDDEKDRLDLKRSRAQVMYVHKVLNSMYPSAKVIGNDLSPIQPEYVAPNAEFVIE